MSASVEYRSLLELASDARAAVERARVANAEVQAQRAFASMRDEAAQHPDRLAAALFCLEAKELELQDDERTYLEAAVRTAANATSLLREQLERAPSEVRSGPTWQAFKESMAKVQKVGEEIRIAAVDRLLHRLPRPRAGITDLLPPGDPRDQEYARLREDYTRLSMGVNSVVALGRLIDATSKLEHLEDDIQSSQVPLAHRARWIALLRGELTLDSLDQEFREWLRAEGHAQRIALNYR